MLKVVYDDFTKTMKFNNTDTVAEVMEKISDAVMKTVGTRPAPQGAHSIFYMSASVLCSSSSDDVAISTLPLKNMVSTAAFFCSPTITLCFNFSPCAIKNSITEVSAYLSGHNIFQEEAHIICHPPSGSGPSFQTPARRARPCARPCRGKKATTAATYSHYNDYNKWRGTYPAR